MPYIPQQAQANLDTDGLRRFTEEEFKRISQYAAQLENGTITPLTTRVTTLEQSIQSQCKFVIASATTCLLAPFNGNKVKINGMFYSIPAGGLSITNAGLAASQQYYCYATVVGGAASLVWANTGHSASPTAGNIGTEILTGNDAYSLVGMVYTDASAQFQDVNTFRGVRSWFNDYGTRMYNNASNSPTITTAPGVWQEDTALRVTGAIWANEQAIITAESSMWHQTASGVGMYMLPYWNGNTPLGQPTFTNSKGANVTEQMPITSSITIPNDGGNIFSLAANVASGNASLFYRNMTVHTIRK